MLNSAPKSINKISVTIKGDGCVFWATGGRRNRQIHTACENYVDHEFVMWDQKDGPERIFPPGSTEFPFEFVIPADCPSTFKSGGGNILYVIEGLVRTNILQFNHRIQRPFEVLELIGIDVIGTRNPIHERTRTMVGSRWCHRRSDGDVGFSGEVPHSAFLMEEDIPVQVHMDNGCGLEIYARCEIVEKIVFMSSHSTYELDVVLSKYETEIFRAYVNSEVLHESLPMPRVRPAVMKSSIIHSQFVIRFTLIIPGKKNTVIDIPIWIGNTPRPPPPGSDDSDN